MTAMTAEIAAKLREPFAAEQVGKLPRVFCKACRDAQFKVCQQHRKQRCRVCGNNITDAHLHLDYVGHAEITDRLLHGDPEWTWEPVAFGPDGLPLRDQMGGLWIRLTVAGVTRLGYGHADGKTGPDAVKEAIGDALRNAAMRFGVALDLWGATFKDSHDDGAEQPGPDRQHVLAKARQAIESCEMVEALPTIGHRAREYANQGVIRPEDVEELRLLADARRAELEAEDRTAEPADPPAAPEQVARAFDQHRRGVHREGAEVAEQPAMDAAWPEAAKPGGQDPA